MIRWYNMTSIELRELRLKHNLTMKALAEKLGVTHRCVANWEYNIRKISPISEKAIICVLTHKKS